MPGVSLAGFNGALPWLFKCLLYTATPLLDDDFLKFFFTSDARQATRDFFDFVVPLAALRLDPITTCRVEPARRLLSAGVGSETGAAESLVAVARDLG